MSNVLIFSDKTKIALELLTAAKEINSESMAITINDDAQAQVLAACGARVYKINNPSISMADTVAVSSVLKQAVDNLDAEYILLASDGRGKELTGRLAQALDAGSLSDVNKILVNSGKVECVRNALGGATVANQVITTSKKVIAISGKSFEAAAEQRGGCVCDLAVDVKSSGIKILETKPKIGESIDIGDADVLVAVGQGLEDQSDLTLVNEIAAKLGGLVGCSKPMATDKKWLSEERIIGLSGTICKPSLAILLGISGQVQFTVGVRDAKTIVAVNNDENASILNMADYILVADLKEVLPELQAALA